MIRAIILAALLATPAAAQHMHGQTQLSETGHAPFAAIAEIVDQLRADPSTDWTKVNIDALRAHLLDMELVTMRASVTTEEVDGGAVFTVTGEGETVGAIQRMTQAHSGMLGSDVGWSMSVETTATGAKVGVLTDAEKDVAQIRGLGFFGIMTVGAHHQMHHLMMATGRDPH